MTKPTISIKQLNEDHEPITLQCESMEEAQFKFDILKDEKFTTPVEIELKNEMHARIDHIVIKPQ